MSSNRDRYGRLTTHRSSNGAGQPDNHEDGLTGRPSAAGSHDRLPGRQQQGVSSLIRVGRQRFPQRRDGESCAS